VGSEPAFDVVPDVPLAAPCFVGKEVSVPGETKQKEVRPGLEEMVLSKRRQGEEL
jgi:hypothetical protein